MHFFLHLISAAALGSTKCIEILHENGAEIDVRDLNGQTPFHLAVAAGQTDCAKLFLSFGTRDSAQDKKLRCCIHLAVEQNREETLDMLLKETGSSLVNVPDHKQRTALHYASYADNSKVVSSFCCALVLPLRLIFSLKSSLVAQSSLIALLSKPFLGMRRFYLKNC